MEKTTQEKIDYIYNHIKKEEKILFWRRFFKFLMYLFFIVYMAYFYFIGFNKLKNTIIEAVKPALSSEKVVEGLKNNSGKFLEKIKNSKFLKDNLGDKLKKVEIQKVEENLEDTSY